MEEMRFGEIKFTKNCNQRKMPLGSTGAMH
jgi:hypothetical protein